MGVTLLALFDKATDVSSACTFVQFIEEEAIQTCSLGMFMAARAKCWPAVSRCLMALTGELIPHLKTYNEIIGWLAPYSKTAFADFVLAAEVAVGVYVDLLQQAATKTRPP